VPDAPITITDAARGLRAKEFSSVELVQAALDRADELDAKLGVYLERFDGPALARAAQADAELARGRDLGPLHGLPIGVKDIIAAHEGPTTANSLILDPAWGDGKDAVVMERIRAAGAVITGKVTTSEFALAPHDRDKPHPRPLNPWNPERWTGGSSSGTGAGVAAGLFLAGFGTDTGGSIRMPAAYCGLSGLMGTYGRVPTAGCVPLGYSLDHIGPLTRRALDCGHFLAAIAGDDPRDPYTVAVPPLMVVEGGSLKGVRVGVFRPHQVETITDPALEGVFDDALAALRELGAELVEVELPLYPETETALRVTMRAEGFAYHQPDMTTRWKDYYRLTREILGAGTLDSSADYVQAQRVRRAAQRKLVELFNRVDVIAMPTTGTGAPTYDDIDNQRLVPRLRTVFTGYWDAVGNPALVVPMGFSSDAMPLSLQLAGRPFSEAMLVAVGDAFQSVTDWHLRTPPSLTESVARRPETPIAAVPPAWPAADEIERLAPVVDTLLAAAGIDPSVDERVRLTRTYAMERPAIAALYALEEARYESPALVFRAEPKLAEWGT
jgi:aspartyl-tRNA(Asn)/glutamyl-tRNA(Gln) amidotransferase subunit A